MNRYLVAYDEPGVPGFRPLFECEADNVDHAREQALNAYPDASGFVVELHPQDPDFPTRNFPDGMTFAYAACNLYHLSFVHPLTGFLGVAIVRAPDEGAAVDEAWDRRCNPGGQVRIYNCRNKLVRSAFMNRLLTREEAEASGV